MICHCRCHAVRNSVPKRTVLQTSTISSYISSEYYALVKDIHAKEYNVLLAQRKLSNWVTSKNNKKSICFILDYYPNFLGTGISTIQVMVVISLNEVHVWWKVGCLLGCWIIMGLGFCSILEGYYSFPDDPDFRRLWVCSGRYLNSLLPLYKPALVASTLPS